MKIEDINVGDMLRVREWDDMVEEYGIGDFGSILCDYHFVESMKKYCGVSVIVTDIRGGQIITDKLNHIRFNFSADMFEPVEEDNITAIDGLLLEEFLRGLQE